MEHPAVAEAGVIGKPDPVAMEVVKAFVSLKPAATSRPRRSGASCSASPASGSARSWPRRRSTSWSAAQDPQRKDHAPAAQGPRAGLPEGDTLDAGGDARITLDRDRCTRSAAARDAPHPPLRGEGRRALQPRARSAASCTSTSARRPSRSARCRRSRPRTRSSPPTASTATRWRAASPPDASWPRCSARRTAAAADAAARCTSSTSAGASTAATPSSAAACPIAVGLALADKMQARAGVTACFFGDGAVDEGEFHESLNLAALWKLPVLFVCENNLYAMGTALARHQAQTDIRLQGRGLRHAGRGGRRHGRRGRRGRHAARGRGRAPRGDGPRFLELRTYRFRAHSMSDPELYRSKEEVEQWKQRDPIAAFAAQLAGAGASRRRRPRPPSSRSGGRDREAVAFAEAGPWEPVAT